MEISADLLYYEARVAERLKRPYDTVEFMNQAIIRKPRLNIKERELLFSGYKKIIDSLRYIINMLKNYLEDDFNSTSSENLLFQEHLSNYLNKYINNLTTICKKAISAIDNILLLEANESESCVFYHKTRADYYRYIAELKDGAERDEAIKKSEISYQTALRVAQANPNIKKSDPLYLSTALNYSVCEYEFMKKKNEVIEFSECVFKEAVKTLDELEKEKYNQSVTLMQLIRDNITQWTNED